MVNRSLWRGPVLSFWIGDLSPFTLERDLISSTGFGWSAGRTAWHGEGQGTQLIYTDEVRGRNLLLLLAPMGKGRPRRPGESRFRLFVTIVGSEDYLLNRGETRRQGDRNDFVSGRSRTGPSRLSGKSFLLQLRPFKGVTFTKVSPSGDPCGDF